MLSSAIRQRFVTISLLPVLVVILTTSQTKRLYQVLEDRLVEQRNVNRTAAGTKASTAGSDEGIGNGDGPWIVGDRYTIADIACFSWVNWAEWAGVSLDDFP